MQVGRGVLYRERKKLCNIHPYNPLPPYVRSTASRYG